MNDDFHTGHWAIASPRLEQQVITFANSSDSSSNVDRINHVTLNDGTADSPDGCSSIWICGYLKISKILVF